MNYIKSLDGLRALAVLLVMLFHYYYGTYWGFGWIGVQLFFVLSGFLITSILLKSRDSALGQYLKRFYWRRALRIFPLYFGFILGIYLIYLAVKFPADFPALAPYLLSYTYNFEPLVRGYKVDFIFTHFWSLSVEEQFYLFWPFIIYFLSRENLRRFIVLLIILCPLIRFGMFEWLKAGAYIPEELGQLIYRFTPGQIDSFAYGALIPVFGLDRRIASPARFLVSAWMFFVIAGLANAYVIQAGGENVNWHSLGYENGDTRNHQYIWTYIVVNIAAVATILYLSTCKSIVTNLFASGPAVWVGKVSYGMYVYHWPLRSLHLKFINPHIPSSPVSFALYFLLVFIISYLSFQLVERQILKFKDSKLSIVNE